MVAHLIAALITLAVPPPHPPPLVTYVKEGGVAGLREKVVVSRNGRVTVRSGYGQSRVIRHYLLTQAQLDRLRRVMDAAHVERIPDATPNGCADCFGYDITYGGHEVTVYENAIPAPLAQPIALLDDLAEPSS